MENKYSREAIINELTEIAEDLRDAGPDLRKALFDEADDLLDMYIGQLVVPPQGYEPEDYDGA
jgi:hypothetical protein